MSGIARYRFGLAWRKSLLVAATATLTVGTAGAVQASPKIPNTTPLIAAGRYHALLVKADGSVWGWGLNATGQLGNGTTTNSSVPVQVTGIPAVGHNVGSLAAGAGFSLAVASNGTVWTWGADNVGQLGNGSTTNSSVPVQVTGLSSVVAVAAELNTAYVLKSDGTVWAWGYNADGELGNGTTTNSSVPVQVSGLSGVKAITAGEHFGMAVLSNGTVAGWGSQSSGELGNGATSGNALTPTSVFGLSNVATRQGAIASGPNFTFAILNDGTVQAWGWNGAGELANGTVTDSSTPVAAVGLSNVAAVGAGWYNGYAVSTSGTVSSWGDNSASQLGNGTVWGQTYDALTPVQVSMPSSTAISVAGGFTWAVALTSSGAVYGWGDNSDGQLGNGTTTGPDSVPVQTSNTP